MKEMIKVHEERIRNCASFTDALKLCLAVSGRSAGEVAWDCGWTDGGRVLSRILRDAEGDDQRYMPHKRLKLFMLACRNAVPLWWLMMQLELKPEDAPHFEANDSFLHMFAMEQLACEQLLVEVLTEVKSAAPAEASDGAAQFCLVEREVIPAWLVAEVVRIARSLGSWSAMSDRF